MNTHMISRDALKTDIMSMSHLLSRVVKIKVRCISIYEHHIDFSFKLYMLQYIVAVNGIFSRT